MLETTNRSINQATVSQRMKNITEDYLFINTERLPSEVNLNASEGFTILLWVLGAQPFTDPQEKQTLCARTQICTGFCAERIQALTRIVSVPKDH